MKRSHKIVAGIIATVALGIAAAAFAYPGGGHGQGFGPCMGDGPGMGYGPRGGGYGPQGAAGPSAGRDPVAFAESRLGEMRSELKITTAQDAAWQTFAAKAKKQAEDMQTMRKTMWGAPAASAPERIAQRTALMQQRLAGMEDMTAALKELYAVLTPEQKAIADREFATMPGHHMGHGRRYR